MTNRAEAAATVLARNNLRRAVEIEPGTICLERWDGQQWHPIGWCSLTLTDLWRSWVGDDAATRPSAVDGDPRGQPSHRGGALMESLEAKVDSLRIIPAFAGLPAARLRLLAQAAEKVRFDAGEVIVRQGDPGDAVYALTKGEAEVWLTDVQKDPVLLRHIGPGHLFGETAVLYQGLRSATIKAKTDVDALKLSGNEFLELLRSTPGVAVQIAVILAQRLASDRHTLAVDPTGSGGKAAGGGRNRT
jgi:CRP/FNR family transcriptional regulator, cyclic AMP receptor protein